MLRGSDAAIGPVVGAIDPVIDPEPRICDASLLVDLGKAGIKDGAQVCLAVPVRVFQVQNVGSASDNQAAFPRHESAHGQQVIGKDGGAVDLAIPVCVLEQPDAGSG